MSQLSRFYAEASEYSNYEGDMVSYQGMSSAESGYFAQGGMEAQMQNVVEPLNRTFTFVITNANLGAGSDTAILFAGNITPLVQPAGITVTVQETGGGITSHDEVRNESLGNPFIIQGLRYFFGTTAQAANAFTIQKRFVNGKLVQYLWQPTNYLSPSNLNPSLLDSPDFGVVVDGRTQIQVPVNRGAGVPPVANVVTLVFTVKAQSSNSNWFFNKPVKDFAYAPRPAGVPIFDAANNGAPMLPPGGVPQAVAEKMK